MPLKTYRLEATFRETKKNWNASRFYMSTLRRGHANLLCTLPILSCARGESQSFSDFIYTESTQAETKRWMHVKQITQSHR